MSTLPIKHQLRVLSLETWSEWLRLFRQPAFTLPSLLFPWLFYLFFGVVFGGANNAEYMLTTYGAFGVVGAGMFGFGVGVAVDRQQGLLQLKRVLPMPMSAYFLAKIGTCLIFCSLILSGLFLIAILAGGVTLSIGQWLTLTIILIFGSLPFCCIGLVLGLMSSAQAAPALINLLYLPMAFLSGLWIPIFILPAVIQKIALIFPAYHLAQMALAVVGRSQGHPVTLHILMLVLFTAICLVLSGKAWRKLNDR